MNDVLVDMLKNLRRDPTVALYLYEHLFKGQFWAMVQDPTAPVGSLLFGMYPTRDGITELPVFTAPDRSLIDQLTADPASPITIRLAGPTLWTRMLDIVETGKIEIAVDPGEEHGIRLNREMILGMVGKYGADGGADRPPMGPP